MTAATWFVGWLVLGQVSTLPVPVASPSSRRAAETPSAIIASPAQLPASTPPHDGMRSVLAVRNAANQELAAPGDDAAPAHIEPISAQPLRQQPTVAPMQSPNPPGQVLGAAFNEPAALSNQPPAAGQGLAKRLVTQAFPSGSAETNATGTTISTSMSLRAALTTTTDRGRQLAIIKTYWEASSLLADWQFAREELQLVDDLPSPRTPADQASLAAAQTAAQARYVEAEMASITARFALADAAGFASDEPPLPGDVPFVGKYRTEYESLFIGRAAPVGVKRIHATLPLRRELVDARAAAVVAGVNSLDEQIAAYRGGQIALGQVLSAMNSLRLQRGAFLGAVRDYNLDIAEYALAASQPADPPEKIVAMLIEVDAAELTRSVLVAPEMQQMADPTNTTFAAPAQLSAPVQISTPRLAANNPPAQPNGGNISSPANALRPSTERVLGSFRDVTTETQATEVELRPRSSFGAVNEQSDLPPSLPPP